MMFAEETPAPLVHVKALIWFKSAGAAALAAGVLWGIWWNKNPDLVLGLLLCGMLWFAGLAAVALKAEALKREDLRRATGLPGWILGLLALGQFIAVGSWGLGEEAALILPANLVVGVTILTRRHLSKMLEVPYHRPTSTALLAIFSMGTMIHGAILVLCLAAASC